MAFQSWTPKDVENHQARVHGHNPGQPFAHNRFRARVRTPKGKMNKTEEAYSEHLEAQRLAGQIMKWRFEPFKLRLAKATFYDVDFMVTTAEGFIEIHEVKGHWEDDARVKIKVAAEMFPEFQFLGVQRKKGTWEYEVF